MEKMRRQYQKDSSKMTRAQKPKLAPIGRKTRESKLSGKRKVLICCDFSLFTRYAVRNGRSLSNSPAMLNKKKGRGKKRNIRRMKIELSERKQKAKSTKCILKS